MVSVEKFGAQKRRSTHSIFGDVVVAVSVTGVNVPVPTVTIQKERYSRKTCQQPQAGLESGQQDEAGFKTYGDSKAHKLLDRQHEWKRQGRQQIG